MKTTKRRLLSLFMAMVMVFSLLPTALAEGNGDEQPPVDPPPVETPEPGDPEEPGDPVDPPAHEHNNDNTWMNDEKGHWHECTAANCPDNGRVDYGTHTVSTWTVEKEATCKDEGLEKGTCSVCGYEQSRTIPKTSEHTKGPTPEYRAKDNKQHIWECAICGQEQLENHNFANNVCNLCGFEQSVTISLPSTLSLAVGKTGTLTATVSPAGTAVSWSVNNDVVTISGTGTSVTVTAVKAGTATITATAGGETASCTVTVTDSYTVEISPTQVSLASVGQQKQLTAKVKNGNDIVTPTPTITWKSNNTSVATVDQNGLVTAKGSGTTTITASSANATPATCTVTVSNPLVLETSTTKLTSYDSEATLRVKFNGKTLDPDDVKWSYDRNYIDLNEGSNNTIIATPVARTTSTKISVKYTTGGVEYSDSVTLSISFSAYNVATVTIYNSTDNYNLDDPDDEGDDSIIDQLETYFNKKSSGYYGIDYVEFETVSHDYGTLDAKTSGRYYVDGSSSSRYNELSDVTFSPRSNKTGSAVFSLTVYAYVSGTSTSRTEAVSCTITFKVKEGEASGGDVEYTAALGEDVPFSASDFEDFWDDMYSRGELESVSFKVSGGTLRDSDGKTVGSKECYVSPTRSQIDLDGVYFEPNSTTSKKAGTVKFTFTATGYARNSSKSTTKTGTVSITYMAGSPKDISYTVNANGSVNLKASDFTAAYKEATGSNAPSGMTIILKSVPRNGTLTYTDSSKSRPTDLKLTSSNIKNRSFTTRSSGTNQINDISYSGNSGTDTIEYTAYSGNSAQFTGKIVFNGAPTAPTNLSVTFTSTNGSPATMSTAAFTTANATVMGKTYRMRFTTPTNGSLLLNGATTAVGVDIFPSNLGSVSYRPKAGFNGSDKCLFMAYDASGNLTGSGTVNFVVAGNPSTTNPGGNTGASSISQFKDVPATAWYRTELADLVSKGIIKGKSATSFAPRDNVTYGEALKMVLRAAGHTAEEATGNNWAINYKNLAVSKGWIDNSIVLTNAISRAAMADLVAKVLGVASSGAASPFADTANGYAVALYNTNPRIFNGETGKDGKLYFNGGDSLKREQICAVIYRVNQYYTNNSSNQMPDGI